VFFHRRLDVFVQQSFTRMRRQRLGQRGGPFLLEGQPPSSARTTRPKPF